VSKALNRWQDEIKELRKPCQCGRCRGHDVRFPRYYVPRWLSYECYLEGRWRDDEDWQEIEKMFSKTEGGYKHLITSDTDAKECKIATNYSNNRGLTDRQREVMDLHLKGFRRNAIAIRLDIDFSNVSKCLSRAKEKVEVIDPTPPTITSVSQTNESARRYLARIGVA
jgi:DNA-binding CsgD family transcriptional regulator